MKIIFRAALCVGLVSYLTASAQITLLPSNTPNSATNVTVAWDPSSSSEVAGYYIYYGTNSGIYDGKLDVGNVTSACLGVSPRGTVYYFAVDAYDASNIESPFSNEISYSAPNQGPQSPLVLLPGGSLAYGSTNVLSTTGGSGTGTLSYRVLSGPAYLGGASNNLLITTGIGTVVVVASKAADTSYFEAAVTNVISVTPAPQTISFSTIAGQKETNVVTLAAKASSGLPVTFNVQSGPGIISGTQLSFTGGGNVVVVASQSGNGLYQPAAPVTQTVSVSPVSWPKIATSASSLAFAGEYGGANPSALNLTVNNSGEIPINFAVSTVYSGNGSGWLSTSPSTGAITAFGSVPLAHSVNVKGLSAGVYYATNTATSAEATNGSVRWVVQLTVSRASQAALVFKPLPVQAYGATNVLSATGGSGTGAVSYEVLSGPGIITGGSNLVITAGVGEVLVQASKAGDTNYSATNITASITASKAAQTIMFPAIAPQKNTNVVSLVASASSELPVTFAVVKGHGAISGTELRFSGTGTVLVSASQAGNDNYLAASSVTNSISVTSYLKGPSNVRISSGK